MLYLGSIEQDFKEINIKMNIALSNAEWCNNSWSLQENITL